VVEIAASCAPLDDLVNRCQAHGYSLSDLVWCRLCQAVHGSETEVAFADLPLIVRLASSAGETYSDQTLGLSAGESTTLTFMSAFPVATCSAVYTATIDPDNMICECDGANNEMVVSVENTIPDITISSLDAALSCETDGIYSLDGTISLANAGCSGGYTDTLPAALEFAGPVTINGSTGTVAQTVEDMPTVARDMTVLAGRHVTVTLPVKVVALGVIENTAWVNALQSASPATDSETLNAEQFGTHMTGCPDRFCPGWILRYSFWFTNTMPTAISNAVITDAVPLGVSTVVEPAWNEVPFDYDGHARIATWRIASMAPDEVVRLGIELHSYSSIADGTTIVNTIHFDGDDVAQPGSESVSLTADRSLCGQPPPTLTPEPTDSPILGPTPEPGGESPLFLPLLYKQGGAQP